MIGWKACKKVNAGYKKFCTGGVGGSKYTEFEVGKTYSVDGNPELCRNGYHFYRPEDFIFGITLFGDDTVFIEIETSGEVIEDTEKRVSSAITILRYIPTKEWKKKINVSRNSGDWNSGSSNSGDCNSGSRNSGD